MPFYDYACLKCQVENKDGTADIKTAEIFCSMNDIQSKPLPTCPRCQETMKRVWNQRVFDTFLTSKGIFPQTFENWGNKPVTVGSRQEMKEAMRKHDIVEYDFSPEARDRHKDNMDRRRRVFSMNPSKG